MTMRKLFPMVASFLVFGLFLNSQTRPAPKPDEIVREWMDRWTKLDGSDDSAARFAELYTDDGVHQTGPSPRQIGLAYYEGRSDISQMAKAFGEANSDITFRIHPLTANEKTLEVVHVGDGPWGGPSIAIEYVAAYTVRKDKKRFMSTGAVFLQVQGEKIRRTRMYTPREEIMEISP